MGKISIDEIIKTPLKRIPNPSGDILHAIKNTDNSFTSFGEAYFSIIKFDMIKAWKKHLKMTCNLVVPKGSVLFVFYDSYENFRQEQLGEDYYFRLTIPPGIWFGFKGLSKSDSLILNIADKTHNPTETKRCSKDSIVYSW